MIFIVNGKPQAGKDTVVNLIAKQLGGRYLVKHISTVWPVKVALTALGWDGETKTDNVRDALSLLKDLGDKLFDSSFRHVKNWVKDTDGLLFVDCREPKKIGRLCEELGAYSLYVDRDVTFTAGNYSDNNTDFYKYDYYIDNRGSLEELEVEVIGFVANVIQPRLEVSK
jgi:hypothetical protein